MPWPDITVTPWYLVYRKIQEALTLSGFNCILDDTTEVQHHNIEKWSEDIVNLCDESLLARTRRSCGKQHCRPRSKNCVTVLRRELKKVFGILLKINRNGRQRIKNYKLQLPKPLIDLAATSSFFSSGRLPLVQRLRQPTKIGKLTVSSSAKKEGDTSNRVHTNTNYTFQNKKQFILINTGPT